MPWTYANSEQTIITNGNGHFVPLGQDSQESRMADSLVANNAVGPYVPPPPPPAPAPAYDADQLTQLLVSKGILPPPS